MRQRITISFAIGIISAVICYSYLITHPNSQAADFSWPWQGARALLAGQNPYETRASPPMPRSFTHYQQCCLCCHSRHCRPS